MARSGSREQKGGFRVHGAQVRQCLFQSGYSRNSWKYKSGRQTANRFIKGPQDSKTILMCMDILLACMSVYHMHT